MVILIFVIVEVKRGSCFSFLIHKKEGGEVFQESRISQRNVPSFFWNIFFLKCTWDDVYNLLKIYYKFARCSTRPDELWKCPIIDEVMINVIRDSFASDVKKLRSKVDASVPFNKSGRASLNGDLPFSTTFAKSAKLRRLFYSPVGNMASHDNFGLWQHLRFLIPKRNWVKPSLFIGQALERVLQKQRKSGRKEEWAGENYYWNRYFSHPPDTLPSLQRPRWTTPKNNPSLSRRFYSIPLARQWIEEDSQGDGGSRESNRFHPWPNTRLIPVTICFFFLSSRSVKGKTSGKRRRRKTANRGGGEGRIGKGREILRRSGRRWRVRERGRRAAISRSTGNARGNEARPARTSGTWTFLRPRERLFLFFLFFLVSLCATSSLSRGSRGKRGEGRWHDCFVAPGHCGRICFLSSHRKATTRSDYYDDNTPWNRRCVKGCCFNDFYPRIW